MNLNNYYILPEEKLAITRILEKNNMFKMNFLIDSTENNIKLTDLERDNWQIYKDAKNILKEFKKIYLAIAKYQLNNNDKINKIYIPLPLREAYILSESKEFFGILSGTKDKFVAKTKDYGIKDLVIIEVDLFNIPTYKTEEELNMLETIFLSPPFSIEDLGEKYVEEGRTFLKFQFRNITYNQDISKIKKELIKQSIDETLEEISKKGEEKAVELETYFVKEKENFEISKELSELKEKYLMIKQDKETEIDKDDIIKKEEEKKDKDDLLDDLNIQIKEKIEEFNLNQDVMEHSLENITLWKKDIREYLERIYIEAVSEIEKERNSINDAKDLTADEREFYSQINGILKSNKEKADKIVKKSEAFIKFQQKFAKIAADCNAEYIAVSEGFKIRQVALELKELMDNIYEDYQEYYISLTKDKTKKNLVKEERYKKIIASNNQIGILINYFNNPKSAMPDTSLDRFAELSLIEENELKRKIAEYVFKLIAKAHIKLIEREIDIQENKTALEKILIFLTGRKDVEEFKISENEYKIEKIEDAIEASFPIDKNYSIHEILAHIMMFKRENEQLLDNLERQVEDEKEKNNVDEDDEEVLNLLNKTFDRLDKVEDSINNNFGINVDKVVEIMTTKSPLSLPETNEKRSVKELDVIENETNAFLKQYRLY